MAEAETSTVGAAAGAGESLSQEPRSADPAVPDARLALGGPPDADVLARQVDYCVEVFQVL